MLEKIFRLLDKSDKKQFLRLCVLSVGAACFDLISVASFIPFLSAIASQELLITDPIIQQISTKLKLNAPEDVAIFLGFMAFLILLISVSVRALNQILLVKFTFGQEYRISSRLFNKYLSQDYSWFLNQHSAKLGTNLLSETSRVVNGVISPILQLFSQSVLIIAMFMILFWVDYQLTIAISLVLGLSYVVLYSLVKSYIEELGKRAVYANKMRYTVSNETFSLIKELKVYAIEKVFEGHFIQHAQQFANASSRSSIIGQLPRYFFEAIGFGGILLIVLYLRGKNGDFVSSLDVIGVYALAGYKMLPATQQIFYSLSQLKFGKKALETIEDSFKNLSLIESSGSSIQTIKPACSIQIKNLNYSYPGSSELTLNKISIEIPANKTVAFVGKTGSGKTTLIDLLLGLHNPTSGSVLIDGKEIKTDTGTKGKMAIGYVPQQVALIDESVASNIALGVPKNSINRELLEETIAAAGIKSFVMNELPAQLDTIIGEKGVRLSGGQRQRLGIARALYFQPDLLVLDEATSALDNKTERAVMKAIEKLNGKITVVIIAHRIDTIRNADVIFVMHKGKVVGKGEYQELMKTNKHFNEIAENRAETN